MIALPSTRRRSTGVMAVVEVETDDHLTSHWVLARKVLGESKAFALDVATAFRHRKLTREDCERMADGWDDDDAHSTKEEN